DGTPIDADGPHADYDPAAMLAQQELYGTYLGEIYGLLEEIGAAERARLEARAASVDWLETAAFWLIGLGGVIGAGAAGAFATVGVRRSRALAAVNRTLRDENLERQRAE